MSAFLDKPYSGGQTTKIKAAPEQGKASPRVLPKRPSVISVSSVLPNTSVSQFSASSPTFMNSPSVSTDQGSPTSPMSTTQPSSEQQGHGDYYNSQLPRPVVLPPRAKPGRKPATDTPASRRKAQNREAQRNFRDRKRQREHDIQAQVRQREMEHLDFIRKIQERHEDEMRQLREQKTATYEEERLQIQKRLDEQQRRNDELNRQVENMMHRQTSNTQDLQSLAERPRGSKLQKKTLEEPQSLQSSSTAKKRSPPRPAPTRTHASSDISASKPTASEGEPNDSEESPMEIDFTNLGKPTQEATPTPFPPLENPDTADESCGFCDANTYCACKGRMVNPPLSGAEASFVSLPKPLEPSAAPIGPGGCRACLDDPERRRICLAMASRRQPAALAPPPTPTSSSAPTPRSASREPADATAGFPFGNMLPPPPPRRAPGHSSYMGCVDAITYGQTHDPQYHERWTRPDFISRLRVVEPAAADADADADADGEGDRRAGPRRKFSSPQDVEIASIMAAMSASGDAGAKAAADADAGGAHRTAQGAAAGLARGECLLTPDKSDDGDEVAEEEA